MRIKMMVLIVILVFDGTTGATWPCPKVKYDEETLSHVSSADCTALSKVKNNVTTNSGKNFYGYQLEHWIHYKGTFADRDKLPASIVMSVDTCNVTLIPGEFYFVVVRRRIFEYVLLDREIPANARQNLDLPTCLVSR